MVKRVWGKNQTSISGRFAHRTTADDSIPTPESAFGGGVSSPPRVLIVGAGLTGCTLADALARESIHSVLLERASRSRRAESASK